MLYIHLFIFIFIRLKDLYPYFTIQILLKTVQYTVDFPI